MLTLVEKILFALAVLAAVGFGWRTWRQALENVLQGQGELDFDLARRRLVHALKEWVTLRRVFRMRTGVALLHGFVAWAFMVYLLVNVGDVLEGYIPDFRFLGTGVIGGLYRLVADVLSVAALVGMAALLLRRFVFKSPVLFVREDVLLHEKARASGIQKDSLIVGVFILLHVGARFVGQSFRIAREGPDPWQPFANGLAALWQGLSPTAVVVGEHLGFWLALGLILLFIPYFPRSKHFHLVAAFFNFLFQPERPSYGALDALDFEDESIEQFGASTLKDLSKKQLLDAYACIMCMRCQQMCPAYSTGKVLSPAALEINKRYLFNDVLLGAKSREDVFNLPLVEAVIPPEALWACTACGACVEVCPVGNEPMRDILDIRRAQVLMESDFPEQWQTAYRGMETVGNPWNIAPEDRLKWTQGLDVPVPTVDENPDYEVLWWVGCAPATEPRAQRAARAFAKILHQAGVNFAVLGTRERCTGDAARRSGNEYLFYELALTNVETLNDVGADKKRIVTMCPHCLHTLKNEYPAFGGQYEVVHHTQFIQELIQQGKLRLSPETREAITYHDPCFLGRYNRVFDEPRFVIKQLGNLNEMALHGPKSFCCGAGGAQIWKEEAEGTDRINHTRFRQAQATGAKTLAVACPFCMIMLDDARRDLKAEDMQVRDIAELVADGLA